MPIRRRNLPRFTFPKACLPKLSRPPKKPPGSIQNRAALGRSSPAQLATGHLADARQAAETATQRGPEDPRAWIQLAASLNAAHDFSTAKTAAEQATQLAPGEARAWLNLATAYAGLDEYRDAIPHAEKATQLEPKNRAGWNLLAALYRELNRTEEADAASTRARALDLPPTDR